MYIGVTLALGCVFLGIKAYEYKAKFEHDILPGQIGENVPECRQVEGVEQPRRTVSRTASPHANTVDPAAAVANQHQGQPISGRGTDVRRMKEDCRSCSAIAAMTATEGRDATIDRR